jgi:hypothetical protein
MPRFLAAILVMAMFATTPLSAQNDTTPSASGDTTGDFRPGQWGARFISNGGVYGAGALYFTAPRTAWLIEGYLSAAYMEQNDAEYNGQNIVVLAGKRWYGERHGRVRSIGGAGVLAGFSRGYSSMTDDASEAYTGGIYGELGAAVFFTPHLSLGANWRAFLSATYYDQDNDVSYYNFSAGPMSIEGAFYF